MENAVDVSDYLRLAWKYRRLLVLLPASAVGLVLAIFLLGPKQYKADMFLDIGKVVEVGKRTSEFRYLEEPAGTASWLKKIIKVDRAEPLAGASIISIRINGFHRDKLINEERELREKILERHNKDFEKYHRYYVASIDLLKNRLELTEKEVGLLEHQRPSFDTRLNPVWNLNAVGKSILLERRDQYWNLQSQMLDYQAIIDGINFYPSKFIGPDQSVKLDLRWPASLLAVSFCGGLLLALVIAMFREIGDRQARTPGPRRK